MKIPQKCTNGTGCSQFVRDKEILWIDISISRDEFVAQVLLNREIDRAFGRIFLIVTAQIMFILDLSEKTMVYSLYTNKAAK